MTSTPSYWLKKILPSFRERRPGFHLEPPYIQYLDFWERSLYPLWM
jgi:hypothetical protein